MSIAYFVEIYFSYDRPAHKIGPEWVKERIELFEKYTMRSLLNQTFKDFKILLYCGERNRKTISDHIWHDRVNICYDLGKAIYSSTSADHISITRLDSDDYFHPEAMDEVRKNVILSNKRECLLFRWHYQWDIQNKCVRNKYQIAGPFFTHIFPNAIYKNWLRFSDQHFVEHARAGGRLPGTKELRQHMLFIINHWQNTSYLKRGKLPPILDIAGVEKIKREIGENITFDYGEIYDILKEFGITKKMIDEAGR